MEKNGKQVIHINFDPAIVDNVYFPQVEVVGNVASSVQQMTEKLGACPKHDTSVFKNVIKLINEHISEKSDDTSFPMKPLRAA